jgi:hypothetical protein
VVIAARCYGQPVDTKLISAFYFSCPTFELGKQHQYHKDDVILGVATSIRHGGLWNAGFSSAGSSGWFNRSRGSGNHRQCSCRKRFTVYQYDVMTGYIAEDLLLERENPEIIVKRSMSYDFSVTIYTTLQLQTINKYLIFHIY